MRCVLRAKNALADRAAGELKALPQTPYSCILSRGGEKWGMEGEGTEGGREGRLIPGAEGDVRPSMRRAPILLFL